MKPLVSIILPAYNCEKYIVAAVQSIINQSYDNFELIILEDSSTDNTYNLLQKFDSNKIKLIHNEKNIGLLKNLNKGIEAVSKNAVYIARMDGDDIAESNRIKTQVEFLIANPNVDAVFSTVDLIDENDSSIGFWHEDKMHTDELSIKKYLPKNNCLAHPTLLIKKEILTQFMYNENQPLSEDYDLWLRLISQNKIIKKINQPLLKHRILNSSFTRTRNINIFKKIAIVKFNFIQNEIKNRRINSFILKTFYWATFDLVMACAKFLKNKLKS